MVADARIARQRGRNFGNPIAKSFQFSFKSDRTLDLCLKLDDFFIEERINKGTGRFTRIPKAQNSLDVGEAEVECLGFLNKLDLLEAVRAVVAVVVAGTIDRLDQVEAFVVAQGPDGDAGFFGEFTDFEQRHGDAAVDSEQWTVSSGSFSTFTVNPKVDWRVKGDDIGG